jgi:class 3 adenylate cyclase
MKTPAPKTPTATYSFTGKASYPKNAVALLYDLEGFSRFFNQPDVQDYIPAFLNLVSAAIGVNLFGGDAYWAHNATIDPLKIEVAHEKFMGDGALYILLPPAGASDFPAGTLQHLCNRLWTLNSRFDAVVQRALELVPVVEVPSKVRFGLSRGSVYELQTPGAAASEYIGFSINLASRLQKYCPELGFVASARLMLQDREITKHGFMKVVATQLRGFPDEIVVIDRVEYEALPDETRKRLFKEPQSATTDPNKQPPRAESRLS